MATYLALQCYHCKTMQAKQEKKSSNKWKCAICNEKQSLQRVFARSDLAKDIRLFVQNFNFSSLSQQMHKTISHPQTNSPPQSEQNQCFAQPTKQNKWAEYLDLQQDQNLVSNTDNYNDAAFVTALPDPPLGKRKRQAGHIMRDATHNSKDSDCGGTSSTFGGNLENYGFVLPNQKKIHGPDNGEEPKSIVGKVGKGKYRPSKEEGGRGTATGCFVREKVSKWASYLDIDSSDTKFSKCGAKDVENELEGGIIQMEGQGLVIEEDVHPDFL